MSDPYLLDADEVIKNLSSSSSGLDEAEVAKRRAQTGGNFLPREKSLSSFRIFLEQFRSPLIYVLFFAGLITLFVSDYTDTLMILTAVFLNAIVGFFQEKKASNALASLKKVIKNKATVIRADQKKEILQEELVEGDIVVLKPGDKVPADARIIKSEGLKTNEASLTGEWLAVDKTAEKLTDNLALGDRKNMVYMGTMVESGHALAIVTSIGEKTEIGKIAQLISSTKEEETPYQKKLHNFGRTMTVIVIVLAAFIFILGIRTGENFVDIFLASVALAVASIPEGLPIAMTVVLALGMQRILKKQGLVRKLAAAESLGSTTIICVDKTGTLTEGKMVVDQSRGLNSETLKIAAYCSEAYIENPKAESSEWILRGRPTDRALTQAAIERKIYFPSTGDNIIDRLEFKSENKMSGCIVEDEGKKFFYLLGAPEKVFSHLGEVEDKDKLLDEFQRLTAEGMRVLATAQKPTDVDQISLSDQSLFSNLEFKGFISLQDPLREETRSAVLAARAAGLRPIMLTGDHKLTAKRIAQELDFQVGDHNIVDGEELSAMSAEDFQKRVGQIDIYARLEPAQKLKIVEAFQAAGEVVAMTGDGVNDAPALKKADIGVALGSGSQVSQEVSDLVLLDDNFSTIVAAIGEGRVIVDNIRKSIVYLVADSISEIFLITLTIILGWPLPVLAAQILWINLIEDGLPTVALAFEPKEKDVMKRKPNPKSLPLLTKQMLHLIFAAGLSSILVLATLYYYLLNYTGYDQVHIRTIMFAALSITTLLGVFSFKTFNDHVWKVNILSNIWLVFSCLAGIVLLLGAIYLPVLQTLLRTASLPHANWLLILAAAIVNIILVELSKFMVKHNHETVR